MDNANGVIDQTAGSSGVATETAQPGGSIGSEHVASDGAQAQESNAGGERSSSEDGREQGTDTRRPRFKSKNETIWELRHKLKERDSHWENEVGSLKSQLAEIQKMFGRGQNQKPSRTFWEAPEEVMDERFQTHTKNLKDELLQELRQERETTSQNSEWKQETSEAAKFIKSQKGITEEDMRELQAIILDNPTMERLRPMERAEYALFLYNRDKGVSDKTDLKQRAAGVQGAAPKPGGPKIWTEKDMEVELQKLGDPKNWKDQEKSAYDKLEREFRLAYSEGRVKK